MSSLNCLNRQAATRTGVRGKINRSMPNKIILLGAYDRSAWVRRMADLLEPLALEGEAQFRSCRSRLIDELLIWDESAPEREKAPAEVRAYLASFSLVFISLVFAALKFRTGRDGGPYLPAQLKPLACRRPKARAPPQHMPASPMP